MYDLCPYMLWPKRTQFLRIFYKRGMFIKSWIELEKPFHVLELIQISTLLEVSILFFAYAWLVSFITALLRIYFRIRNIAHKSNIYSKWALCSFSLCVFLTLMYIMVHFKTCSLECMSTMWCLTFKNRGKHFYCTFELKIL